MQEHREAQNWLESFSPVDVTWCVAVYIILYLHAQLTINSNAFSKKFPPLRCKVMMKAKRRYFFSFVLLAETKIIWTEIICTNKNYVESNRKARGRKNNPKDDVGEFTCEMLLRECGWQSSINEAHMFVATIFHPQIPSVSAPSTFIWALNISNFREWRQ